MAKPILISISPNTDSSDVKLSLKLIFQPWLWQQGKAVNQLKNKLKKYFHTDNCFLLNSGRTGLYLALKSLKLKPTDEILCQAFTCVAVPNSIIWAKARPVFVDTIKNGFNVDINDLAKKITNKSKAVIIQHTFGNPDNISTIKKLCRQHDLVLIEDCAHSLGAEYNSKKIGTFGDLTILSFGRDKVISSVFGGALIINNKKFIKSIKQLTADLKYPSLFWIFQQLLHPIIFSLIIPVYFSWQINKFTLGKFFLFFLQKINLVSQPVSQSEKNNQMTLLPQKLPNALASLAVHQFSQLKNINQARKKIASQYQKNLNLPSLFQNSIYLRFPLLVNQPEKLIKLAKKQHILLGNWYRPSIAPQGVNLRKIHYQPDSCPHAQAVSQKIINLPTHPKMNFNDIKRITRFFKQNTNY